MLGLLQLTSSRAPTRADVLTTVADVASNQRGSTITLDTVVRQADNLAEADIHTDTALMSIEKGNYYLLNEVGSHIWKIVRRPTSLTDICASIVAEFEVNYEECQSDVVELVREMLKYGLLEIVEK